MSLLLRHTQGCKCLLVLFTHWFIIIIIIIVKVQTVTDSYWRCTPCLKKKLCKLIFGLNFVKFRLIVKIFGTKIAKTTSFSKVCLFSTSPNLCARTTV